MILGMKTIQVPLTEYDANMLQVALGRSDIKDTLRRALGEEEVAESFDRLYEALIKAINDSW